MYLTESRGEQELKVGDGSAGMGPLLLLPLLYSRSKEHINVVKSFSKRKNEAKLYPWLLDGWEQSLCKAEKGSRGLDPEQAERFWTQPALWSLRRLSLFTRVGTQGAGDQERRRRILLSSHGTQCWQLRLSPEAGRRSTRDPV